MNTLYKRLFRFLSSPRVAVILLVYICLFAIVGTLVPQTGLEIDSPISAFLEVNVVASAVSTLGLHDAFSSPAFLLPVAFLLMSTCACAWKRFMVARKRSQMIAEISQSQRTVGGRSLGISFPSDRINAHDQKLIADTLEELSFGTPYHSEQLVCASRSVWALYASPLFHILLAITLAVILAGRLTRSEALMVAPIDQTRTITQENLDITQRGAFHTFASPPPNILLISKEENYITDGQPRGSAGELAIITEAGRVEKKQLTYVNRPLSFRSLMIHVADDGFALKFSVLDETNERESSHYEFTRISDFEGEVTANNAHELFQPVRISTEDPDTPYAVFQLMPSIVDGEPVAGKMQDAYGFMWIADEEMRALGDPELIRVGQTYSIAEGKAIRFDGLSSALLLRVVDDWSVPYLYSLAVLTTLALSIALLFCPRFCAIYIDEKTGELKALTRYYRPHAQNAEEIEAKIQHVFAAQK